MQTVSDPYKLSDRVGPIQERGRDSQALKFPQTRTHYNHFSAGLDRSLGLAVLAIGSRNTLKISYHLDMGYAGFNKFWAFLTESMFLVK
jgi:hypothetical protein